jgi:TolB-like protein
MGRFSLVLIALLLSLGVTACAGLENYSESRFSSKSFKSYNYQAVDRLLKDADKKIKKDAPMLVTTIGETNNVEASSTFGRTLSEQVGARLAQQGYKIAELKLRQGISIQESTFEPKNSGEFLLSRNVNEISTKHKAATAITGTYTVGVKKVLVNLRLIDIRTGNIITAYDYEIPKTDDVEAMLGNLGDRKKVQPNYFTRGSDY